MPVNSNVFAFTEPGCSYPAYLSVNVTEGDKLAFSVRTRGMQVPSVVVLTPEEEEKLLVALILRYDSRGGKLSDLHGKLKDQS